MATFKDTLNRDWPVRITFGDLHRVKDRLDLVLIDLTEEDRVAARADADLDRVRKNTPLFIDVLYVLCEADATARGMSSRDFGECLDVESIADAIAAVQEELVVFTLPRTAKGRGRELMKKRAESLRALHLTPAQADVMAGLEASGN